MPNYIGKMIENNWLGAKTGNGFYKRIKNLGGKSSILSLDLETLEYKPTKKVVFDTIGSVKKIENISERFPVLIKGEDKAGEFYRRNFGSMFAYIQNRVPEICDEIYKVDDALKAGYGWQFGPFEIWNSIGLEEGVNL